MRQVKVKMPDERVLSISIDENQPVANLMVFICTKLGITNSDEYSLIAIGGQNSTLDGRKHANNATRNTNKVVDQKLEQMKKKLKTNEDLAWLDHAKTLDEQHVHQNDIVLLRRKYFYSDYNIDAKDPVQLSLLYVQTRDSILNGAHLVSLDGACKFAGLQMQIQLGNYVDFKTPSYLAANIKQFLPEQYLNTRQLEQRVLEEHKRCANLTELDAKARYVCDARQLPTYGITMFLVKELQHENKSKLVVRLFGVTRDAVMRIDVNTKQVIKAWPLSMVKKFAPGINSFTVDFGEYEKRQYIMQTSEGEQISKLIAGYIDIIMRRRKAKDHFGVDGDEGATMIEESVAPSRATIVQNAPIAAAPAAVLAEQPQPEPQTVVLESDTGALVHKQKLERAPVVEPGSVQPASEVRGRAELGYETHAPAQYVSSYAYQLSVPQRDLQVHLEHAQESVEQAQRVLDSRATSAAATGAPAAGDDAERATRNALREQFAEINAATASLVALSAQPQDSLNYPELNAAVQSVARRLPVVARDVRTCAQQAPNAQQSAQLVDAARRLCVAFGDLLSAAEPGPTVARQTLISAASRVGDATHALLCALTTTSSNSYGFDDNANQLEDDDDDDAADAILARAKCVASAAAALVLCAKNNAVAAAARDDKVAHDSLMGAATECALATSQLLASAKIVAPTARHANCQRKLLEAAREVSKAVDAIQVASARARASSVDELARRVHAALDELAALVQQLRDQQASSTHATRQVAQQLQQVPPSTTPRDSEQPKHAQDELVQQARSLARATTQLIQDIHKPAAVGEQQQSAASTQSSSKPASHDELVYRPKPVSPSSYYDQQQALISEEQQQMHKLVTSSQQRDVEVEADDNDNDDEDIEDVERDAPTASASPDTISGIVGDLETTILYATAGKQFADECVLSSSSFCSYRESILRSAKALVEDTKRLVKSTSDSSDERALGDAARDSVTQLAQLASAVKAGAASLGAEDAQGQLSLVRSVKDVASSLGGLISATKAARADDGERDSSMQQVNNSAKSMVSSVTSLLRIVKDVGEQQERGARAIQVAISAISAQVDAFDASCAATNYAPAPNEAIVQPRELIGFTKPLTLAASKTLAAGSSKLQNDAIVAANMGRKAVCELLTAARSVLLNTNNSLGNKQGDSDLRVRTQTITKQTATAYRQLLELLHQSFVEPNEKPEVKEELIKESRRLQACIGQLNECAELLDSFAAKPSTSPLISTDNQNNHITRQQDFNAVAEHELLGAASSIDAAAHKLQNLKPRLTSVKLPHEQVNFDQIILQAAKSIIEATGALLKAASSSQRELLIHHQTNSSPDNTFYASNAQWSDGLVSAAKMVAGATHSLVEASNALVLGAASEERLISAAKQVASSTNQLLCASKVKANPESRATSALQNAGLAVKRATDNLVKAAQQAIKHDEQRSLIISNRNVSGIAQEISAREQILRKEKELQVAKTQLYAIRKAKYANRPDDYQGYGGPLA